MPFIKISTLRNVSETGKIMKSLEKTLYEYDYKGKKLMPKDMATCMWQTTDCMVHKMDEYYEFNKDQVEIPVFVDLYVNTWFDEGEVGKIMEIIADELSKGTKIDRNYVFIHTHVGNPGYIFISGKIWTGAKEE